MAETEALEDFTSKFPQHIIHHILSFLQLLPQEAAKTSLLSKAWLSAWRTRPNLDFCYFPTNTDTQEIEIRRRNNFINSINTTLLRYHENKPGIDSLDLRLPSVSADQVHRWIQIAVENGVKSIDIGFIGDSFMLSQTIFEACSPVELALSNLQLKPEVIKTIRCHNLRQLRLCSVDLDEVMFQRILSSCPLIDKLIITCCEGLVNIKVTKLQKLKHVSINLKEIGCVEIEAPSLEYFCYRRITFPRNDEQTPLRYLRLQMLTCQSLKHLNLKNIGITDEFFLDIAEKFPHLEDLDIQECNDLQRIKISSNSIKRINLAWNWGLREAEIDVPNMDWFGYMESSIPLLTFTAPSNPWISEIELFCFKWETSWFSNLKNLLSEISQSEISLKIDFNKNMASSIADEMMRNSARLPLPQVQKLSIRFDGDVNLDDADAILDFLFWTCRPKTIAQEWYTGLPSEDIRLAKVIFETLIVNQKHAILHKNNSWQNYPKDVKVMIREYEDGEEVQLPPPLAWDSFLRILSTNDFWGFFQHVLEWETSDMAKEQKVSRKTRRKLRKNRTARVAKKVKGFDVFVILFYFIVIIFSVWGWITILERNN